MNHVYVAHGAEGKSSRPLMFALPIECVLSMIIMMMTMMMMIIIITTMMMMVMMMVMMMMPADSEVISVPYECI